MYSLLSQIQPDYLAYNQKAKISLRAILCKHSTDIYVQSTASKNSNLPLVNRGFIAHGNGNNKVKNALAIRWDSIKPE